MHSVWHDVCIIRKLFFKKREKGGSMRWIKFAPVYQERVWGGHNLAKIFSRSVAPNRSIGESWEIVDRPEA